jgi:hypothetical protein
MPVDLAQPARQVDFATAAYEPPLDFESAVTLEGGEYFFAPIRPFPAAL